MTERVSLHTPVTESVGHRLRTDARDTSRSSLPSRLRHLTTRGLECRSNPEFGWYRGVFTSSLFSGAEFFSSQNK